MHFELEAKGAVELPGFASICQQELQDKWIKQQEANNFSFANSFYCSNEQEPISVLHMRTSQSPPTSASTLSSSFNGGAAAAGGGGNSIDNTTTTAATVAPPETPLPNNNQEEWATSFLVSQTHDSKANPSSTESEMSNSFPDLHSHLAHIIFFFRLTKPILDSLSKTSYTPEETSKVSTKSTLETLLSTESSVKDFSLACALLSASRSSTDELLTWIPSHLSTAAEAAFSDLSKAYNDALPGDEKRNLAAELMPEIVPVLKEKIKESSIDKSDETDEFFAASARAPVGFAILAAYQFRWFVCQIEYPDLNKMINLVIPCALTCLDHWSPEVKGQGMISFIHIAKNVKAAELGWYGDVILDACCHNIASADEIWQYVVEMSVLLVTCIQRENPRSEWFEKLLNEMLSHLERQPRNKERRIAWLKFIKPIFNSIGLLLLAHFRRIFPLFFQWMHADDDETVLLVLERVQTVVRLTWLRNTPYVERMVDELLVLFKEAALRRAREEIRTNIHNILIMLQQ